ncbi:unnamed protein product [Heterobilharzia americana]|nr:unnamed protein product [Heterobilharzia americana]
MSIHSSNLDTTYFLLLCNHEDWVYILICLGLMLLSGLRKFFRRNFVAIFAPSFTAYIIYLDYKACQRK